MKKSLELDNAFHIEIINGELGAVKCAVEAIKTDVSWLKEILCKSIWGLGSALVLILIGVAIEILK